MNLENFPISESAKRMIGYVTPGFYDNSYVGKWLYQVMGKEMDDVRQLCEELRFQIYPETATWAILYHEQKYGILVNPNIPLEERRKQILLKRSKDPINPAIMERQINRIVGYPCAEITENISAYTFGIEITEEETAPVRYSSIREYVNRVKPSHLSFLLSGYYHEMFSVPIVYKNTMMMVSHFYSRANLAWLLLDGSWNLDGKYQLGFYKTGVYTDSYPMSLCCFGEVKPRVIVENVSDLYGTVAQKTTTASMVYSESKNLVEKEYQNSVGFRADGSIDTVYESHLKIEVNLWCLDGENMLDGVHLLKAEIIETEL